MAEVTRQDPPIVATERQMLASWLDFHRATLALKCEGLSDDQLKERSVPPSSLSLLGLVRHMADVERAWFRHCFADEDAPSIFSTDENPDADFNEVDSADVTQAFDTWRVECEAARAIAASASSLDDFAKHATRSGNIMSLRWIMVHMIEEYARHNGHADFLRERIDGVTGD